MTAEQILANSESKSDPKKSDDKDKKKKGGKDKEKAVKPLTSFEQQIIKTNHNKVKEELEKLHTMINNQIS